MRTNKKTTTLSDNNGEPISVICPGHVNQRTFNDAFKNEGWSARGAYRQKDLEYIYMVKRPSPIKRHNFRMVLSAPGRNGAKPYTYTKWD